MDERRRGRFARVRYVLPLVLLALVPGMLRADTDPLRDFPPLLPPGGVRPPASAQPDTAALGPDASVIEPPGAPPDTTMPYRIGVGDELSVQVIGQPDLSRVVKVLPDGTITYPSAGSLFVQGRGPREVAALLKERLGRLLRYPDVDVMVNSFGEQRVYCMGEVLIGGDHAYHKGMTALQALAQAGGARAGGKLTAVVIVRRTGPSAADVWQIDLRKALESGGAGADMVLQPYDILYVPRTWIANLNVVVDQWMRQNISPFTLYLEGWNAFNADRNNAIVRTR